MTQGIPSASSPSNPTTSHRSTSPAKSQMFKNPVILNSILQGIGPKSKATLAKIMQVNKACLEAASKLVYKDITMIRGFDLHVHFSNVGVPHKRWISYSNAVTEMRNPMICHLKQLPIPKLISLYPKLSKIFLTTHTGARTGQAKIMLTRDSCKDCTCNSLSIECPLSNIASGDVLLLFGYNPKTQKGYNDIELTKLEFTGGEDCFCMRDEIDLDPSGYDWLFPINQPNRVPVLHSLKVLDLGKNPCRYSQLIKLAGAITSVTHLTVTTCTYSEDSQPGDNLKSLAMKLRYLEKLVFRETGDGSGWSLITTICNLRTFCPNLKELQIPVDLAVTKSDGKRSLNQPTKYSIINPMDHQLSSLKILIDGKKVSSFHSWQFACLLLHLVSRSCDTEILHGHDPSTISHDLDDPFEAMARYGTFRDRVTWAGEVLASKKILLDQLDLEMGKSVTSNSVAGRKGWQHLGPVQLAIPAIPAIPKPRTPVQMFAPSIGITRPNPFTLPARPTSIGTPFSRQRTFTREK